MTELQEDQTCADDILANQGPHDIILYTRTWGVKGDVDKLLRLKRLPLVGFSLDIWWGLRRETELNDGSLFFRCDHLFTADGGHAEKWRKAGIDHHWLPPGVCGVDATRGTLSGPVAPIVFVGSKSYHAEYPHRPALIDWLTKTYGERFELKPNGGPAVREAALNGLYSAATIAVGDSYDSPHYWSDRVPETLGRGGFLIHPRVKGMEDWYTEGVHYAAYDRGDWAGLKKTIDYYLSPAVAVERETIRSAGRSLVLSRDTYAHRARAMVDKIEELHGH